VPALRRVTSEAPERWIVIPRYAEESLVARAVDERFLAGSE
jgi:hypothetical protein